jgi:hypothetical protein
MEGGRTAHNRFKLPISCPFDSFCGYSNTRDTAKLLRKAKLIVWDEAPMAYRYNLECLDRSLRDTCCKPHIPFGGKVVVLAGDFRQTLPVTKRGSRGQVLGAALIRSPLCRHFRIFHLTENMRIATAGGDASQAQWYKNWLLRVGNGNEQTVTNPDDNIRED